MKQLLCVLLVAVLYIGVSEASLTSLRCWTCNEKNVLDCNILNDHTECEGGMCMKTDVGGLITRSCVTTCPAFNIGSTGSFCCDTYLCNAATTTAPCTVLLSLLLAATAALLARL